MLGVDEYQAFKKLDIGDLVGVEGDVFRTQKGEISIMVDKLTLHWFVRDMDIRSKLITSTFQEPLGDLLVQGSRKKINSLISRVISGSSGSK